MPGSTGVFTHCITLHACWANYIGGEVSPQSWNFFSSAVACFEDMKQEVFVVAVAFYLFARDICFVQLVSTRSAMMKGEDT